MKDWIVDNFAGGGGASLGIQMALGRSVDIAINHDPEAIVRMCGNSVCPPIVQALVKANVAAIARERVSA